MRLVLEEYLLKYATEYSVRFMTFNSKLHNRLQHSKLANLLDFVDSEITQYNQHVELSEIVKSQLSKAKLIKTNQPIYRYSNVYDESCAIRASFKGYLVTNNTLLESTVNAMTGIYTNSDQVLEHNLWVKSAEAIFLLDRIRHIDACCNHPWTLDWFKSNLFHKNHNFRNQIIQFFTEKTAKIKQYNKYSSRELGNIHYNFILSITNKTISNLVENLEDTKMTVYEYLAQLKSILKKCICTSQETGDIEVITPEELPWIEQKKQIWIGGLNNESVIDKSFLSNEYKIVGISDHTFANSEIIYSDSGFSVHPIVNNVQEKHSLTYRYVSPCPTRSLRKNAFAINHVTKLLNNPHNFYVENILKLKSHNFHPNHILGIMVHAVFEELIKASTSFKDFNHLCHILNDLLSKNYFSQIDYILISKKAHTMLEHLYEILKDTTKVHAEHEGVQKIIHNGNEYFLHGRADLIYEKNQKYGVIDFKTGNPPSWLNIINGSAPQIPMAMLMLRFGGFLDKPYVELGESGFISPKGLLKIEHDAFIIQSAISGISRLITAFWDDNIEYHLHLTDMYSPYRIVARQVE